MCQAVRDGGRRCPKHKHGSIAIFSALKNMEGNVCSRAQIENIFTELRREALDVTQDTPNFSIAGLVGDITENPSSEVSRQIALTQSTSEEYEPSTQYALARLKARVISRSRNLQLSFANIAASHGTTATQVAEAYNTIADSIDTRRGSEPPAEYTRANRILLKEASLPHDKASVAAFIRVRDTQIDNEAQDMPWTVSYDYDDLNSSVQGYDYNAEHRILRMRFNGLRNATVYGNVTPEAVANLLTSRRPLRTYNAHIAHGPNVIKFETAEEGRAASQVARCNSCGQFTSLSRTHECAPSATGFNPYLENITTDDAENIAQSETVAAAPTAVFEETDRAREARISQAQDALTAWLTESYDRTGDWSPGTPLPEGYTTPHPEMGANYGTSYDQVYRLSYETIPDEITAETALFPHTEENIALIANPQPEPPTKENQSINGRVASPESREVYRNSSFHRVIICNATNYERRLRNYTVPESYIETIRESSKQVMWVLTQNSDSNSDWELKNYDSNLFTGTTSNGSSISISNRGKRIIVGPRNETAELEAQEHLTNIINQDDTVTITGRSWSATTSEASGVLARVSFKSNGYPKRQISEGLSEGKIVVVPIDMRFTETSEKYIDNQGYNVRLPDQNKITGQVAIRMNSEGGIEVLSKERTLKCNCSVYRESYYCRHVNYSHRHVGAIIQDIVPVYQNPAGLLAELPLAARRRNDVQIIENNLVGFSLNTPNSEQEILRISSLRPSNSVSTTPYAFYSEGTVTEEQLEEAFLSKKIFERNPRMRITVPQNREAIIESLKTHDVRVPLSIHEIDDQTLTGVVTYKKNDGDYNNLEVDTSNLRCDCREYRQNNYNCVHTRLVKNNALMFIYPESLRISDTQGLGVTNAAIQETIANQMATQVIAENPGLSNSNVSAQSIAALISNSGTNNIAEQINVIQEYAAVGNLATIERRQEAVNSNSPRINRGVETINNRRANTRTRPYHTYRENMMRRWETVEENTEENFHAVALAARTNRNIDFRTENVTDGICAPGEGTRSFGIEIEFDIARGENQSTVLNNIGRELYEAGLTPSPRQDRYHAAARNGWANWSFEHDSTVAGEIVSPLMKDTPEHWEQLRKVCEIVTRNGGTASARTGSHVHISTGSYENSLAKHYELLRQTQINRQTIFRLATDPARGIHRGTRWCEPNALDERGDIQGNVTQYYMGLPNSHGSDMNFGGCGDSDYDRTHVEFRMWDGTIDPAAIQQQVMVSAALTDLADRNVEQNGISRSIPVHLNELGRGRIVTRPGIPSSRGEFFADDMVKHSYNFINKLFRKQEDRNTVTQLFGRTNWVR